MQTRLFRDGQLIYTGPAMTVDTAGQSDPKHLLAGGRIKLSAHIMPGAYVLQVVVTDAQAKEKKYASAAQWLDFEIVS